MDPDFISKCFTGIPAWLNTYCEQNRRKGFVVGLSGGIDSAVTSTLCALTSQKVIVVTMPIGNSDMDNAEKHIEWLHREQHLNVIPVNVDLTEAAASLKLTLPVRWHEESGGLALANTYARLRMTTLYAIATDFQLLVCGTGNKVEDFGVGFFTKYGDGGVDISPLGDLLKSQVYALGKSMGIIDGILEAAPTDGLWWDERTDEDQLGATYDELEWAMSHVKKIERFDELEQSGYNYGGRLLKDPAYIDAHRDLTEREREVLKIYKARHAQNQHKINPIPVFRFNEFWEGK